MGDLLAPEQIVAAFIGAAFALVGQGIFHRWRDARTAKTLAAALWEELSATEFIPIHAGRLDLWSIAGFSSQTFDTLFPSIAQTLPESLARDIMRYHWRVKLLVEEVEKHHAVARDRAEPSKELRDDLRNRLEEFNNTSTFRLTVWRGEP